jgi:hypothetical protein
MSRLAGLGATFHYESGLRTAIPTGRELECFEAWNSAWTLLPRDIETRGAFRRPGEGGAAVASFSGDKALAVVERQDDANVWVLVVNPRPSFSVVWRNGWRVERVRRFDGAWLITARRSPGERGTAGAP